jgi:hypothetical protein
MDSLLNSELRDDDIESLVEDVYDAGLSDDRSVSLGKVLN